MSDSRIAALLRERDGLARLGKDERVAQIDAELETRGYKAPKEPAPAKAEKAPESETEARKQPPQGRRTTQDKTES